MGNRRHPGTERMPNCFQESIYLLHLQTLQPSCERAVEGGPNGLEVPVEESQYTIFMERWKKYTFVAEYEGAKFQALLLYVKDTTCVFGVRGDCMDGTSYELSVRFENNQKVISSVVQQEEGTVTVQYKNVEDALVKVDSDGIKVDGNGHSSFAKWYVSATSAVSWFDELSSLLSDGAKHAIDSEITKQKGRLQFLIKCCSKGKYGIVPLFLHAPEEMVHVEQPIDHNAYVRALVENINADTEKCAERRRNVSVEDHLCELLTTPCKEVLKMLTSRSSKEPPPAKTEPPLEPPPAKKPKRTVTAKTEPSPAKKPTISSGDTVDVV